jgi:large subunit ribosomal protein L15
MNLHTLKNTPGARHRTKRLGCGEASGHGKTCGRGNKGQYARSGHKRKATFEGGQMRLIRRVPKRGFNNAAHATVLAPINVSNLGGFASGAEVTEATLRTAGLLKGLADGIKVLGDGELSKKLTVKANKFSASARAKIEAAGGSCVVIE